MIHRLRDMAYAVNGAVYEMRPVIDNLERRITYLEERINKLESIIADLIQKDVTNDLA